VGPAAERPVRQAAQLDVIRMRFKHLAFIFAGISSIACFATACTPTPTSSTKATALEETHDTESWPDQVDFGVLREQYGERDDFYQICEADRPLREWFELADEGNWERVLAVSLPWLDHCRVDIDAHFISAVALSELKRDIESRQHIYWFRGLVNSVLESGDGRTSETAYVVISVPEEYAVLRTLRIQPTGQQMLLGGGIDAISVEDEGGRSTVYFNPSAHFRRLAREFGEPE
jgi:hypothetical protein